MTQRAEVPGDHPAPTQRKFLVRKRLLACENRFGDLVERSLRRRLRGGWRSDADRVSVWKFDQLRTMKVAAHHRSFVVEPIVHGREVWFLRIEPRISCAVGRSELSSADLDF